MPRAIVVLLALVLIGAGGVLLVIPYFSEPVEASLEGARRDIAAEAAEYGRMARQRLDDWGVSNLLVPYGDERLQNVELWLLYKEGKYDEIMNRALDAPDEARPHFWRASAQFQKALQSEEKEATLTWLRQSEEQFQQSLRRFPDDWDTKFNYELVHRLVKSLEDPQEPPPVRVLRPKPQEGESVAERKG